MKHRRIYHTASVSDILCAIGNGDEQYVNSEMQRIKKKYQHRKYNIKKKQERWNKKKQNSYSKTSTL